MNADSTYVSKLYAAALFELADQSDMIADVGQDLSEIKQFAASEKEFLDLNMSPYFSPEFKSQLLQKLFANKITDLTLNFLQVVNKHDRMMYLPLIAQDYETLVDNHFGRVAVNVTLSKELNEQEVQNLTAEIASVLSSQVKLSMRVDSSIIGGIVLRKGDMIIDNTIKTQLREAVKAITSHRKNREKIHEI
jgi:F-type H+-transporting ATPase subunit delta